MKLTIEGLTVEYGQVAAVHGLNLTVGHGENLREEPLRDRVVEAVEENGRPHAAREVRLSRSDE